jgi:CRISPR-associated protein Csm3
MGKIIFGGTLECLTGLHIGASKENVEIGAMDSPVVRDPLTLEPYIPGSSLKGKLRSLLERAHPELVPNRNGGTSSNPVMRHECDDWKQYGNTPGVLECPVCRIFGSTAPKQEHKNYPARVSIRDSKLINVEELRGFDTGLLFTEWKFENSIDRVTSAANPRNLERVPRGAKFSCSIVYDVEDVDIPELKKDISNLRLAIELLHDDSLGGHGSRGYGQVLLSFNRIEARKIGFYRGDDSQNLPVESIGEIEKVVKFFEKTA